MGGFTTKYQYGEKVLTIIFYDYNRLTEYK